MLSISVSKTEEFFYFREDLTILSPELFFFFLRSFLVNNCGRSGGLMVSELDSGSSGPGASPGQGHCVVFLYLVNNSKKLS